MLKLKFAALLLTATVGTVFAQTGPKPIPSESGVFTFNTDPTLMYQDVVPFYGTVHPPGKPSCTLSGRMRGYPIFDGHNTLRRSELIVEPGSTYMRCEGGKNHQVFGSFRFNKGNLGWVPPQTGITRSTGGRTPSYYLVGTKVDPNTYGYWETWQDYPAQ